MSIEQEIADADEAFLSFGGWAKAMPTPPAMNERRRYTVDVQCTGGAVKMSDKGDRHTRSLSIIRVTEVTGVEVPPADEDENQPAMFGDDGDGNVVPIGTAAGDE